MTPSFDAVLVERFRALIAQRLGLHFEDARLGWLGEVLRRRMSAENLSAEACLLSLGAGVSRHELAQLAQELTVSETYFFRNIDQFHALREQVLPERVSARANERCIRMLSAGCASGEEPYSIAMTLHGLLPDSSWTLAIDAIDINLASLDKARRGHYTGWSLRETPPAMQQRWFSGQDREMRLDERILDAVRFEQRNLCEDAADAWRPGTYDAIFCRNVLMYFTPDAARDAVSRLARALAPGGVLFLGHAETLRGLSQDFHLRHTHSTFYYQSKTGDERATNGLALPVSRREGIAIAPPIVDVVEAADSWVDAIAQASERVRALTARAGGEPTRDSAPAGAGACLAQALDLFRDERFAQALNLVQALPAESTRDAEVMLLHAVLLVHSGRLALAEDTCHRLLAKDELNAGAHYVLALCREGQGDRHGAADCDRVAAYLDPGFAMPRLHLGLLARHARDRAAQEREFSQALMLLQREDASRVLMFGGGFGREALLALCRAELQACGSGASV